MRRSLVLALIDHRIGGQATPERGRACGEDGSAGRRRWAGDDRQLGESPQHEPIAVTPAKFLERDCEAQLGEPAKQRAEGNVTFHSRQWRTEAEVDAVPEREVATLRATVVEGVRVRVLMAVA